MVLFSSPWLQSTTARAHITNIRWPYSFVKYRAQIFVVFIFVFFCVRFVAFHVDWLHLLFNSLVSSIRYIVHSPHSASPHVALNIVFPVQFLFHFFLFIFSSRFHWTKNYIVYMDRAAATKPFSWNYAILVKLTIADCRPDSNRSLFFFSYSFFPNYWNLKFSNAICDNNPGVSVKNATA